MSKFKLWVDAQVARGSTKEELIRELDIGSATFYRLLKGDHLPCQRTAARIFQICGIERRDFL